MTEPNATDRRHTRSAATRERLTGAAVHAFAERGFADTRVSDIVARAGVTQPTFYYFFPSKEALFNDLIDRFRARVRDLIAESADLEQDLNTPLRDTIRRTCAAVFHAFAEDPALTRLALHQAPDADRVKRDLAALLTGNVRAAQARGRVRPDLPAELIAESLAASVERLTWRYLIPGEIDAETLARHVSELHHDGFAPHGDPR